MVTTIIGESRTYRSINTDHDKSGPSLPVTIEQRPEESGDRIWVLDAIQYSYNSIPPTGQLIVKVGDNVKIDVDIRETNGAMSVYIPSQVDKIISVTLMAGGNGVVGKLNCQWHLEPAA